MAQILPMTPEERRKFYESRNNDVLVDFDGTLCEWSYPNMGPPTPGAKAAMTFLRANGLCVVVNTCRMSPEFNSSSERMAMADALGKWFKFWQIPYDEIDLGYRGKRLAAVSVDDQAVGFRGNWGRAVREILDRVELRRSRG